MSIAHAVLGLLEPAPSHGYTLKQAYDAAFGGGKPMKFGQVYATLARLERDGLAQVAGTVHGDGPDRKIYAITSDGVTEFEQWLATPERPGHDHSVLFAKVVLALRSGRGAEEILDAQRAAHLDRMRQITAARGDSDLVSRLVGDFEIAHLEADLRWIDIAAARLDALAVEVAR